MAAEEEQTGMAHAAAFRWGAGAAVPTRCAGILAIMAAEFKFLCPCVKLWVRGTRVLTDCPSLPGHYWCFPKALHSYLRVP